jgi:hypothetical protein
MWEAHLRGEETSLNPLGMVEAIIGAMQHAENLAVPPLLTHLELPLI